MTQAYAATDLTDRGRLDSVQLDVVPLVDRERAAATRSLEGCPRVMDSGVGGVGRGTDHLEALCERGQVINWIIRPIGVHRRADGTRPPMPKTNNLVFPDIEKGDEDDVSPDGAARTGRPAGPGGSAGRPAEINLRLARLPPTWLMTTSAGRPAALPRCPCRSWSWRPSVPA